MKVKVFDENHEKDLEEKINRFINEKNIDVMDIKFQVAVTAVDDEQIYCFSAMIVYKEVK